MPPKPKPRPLPEPEPERRPKPLPLPKPVTARGQLPMLDDSKLAERFVIAWQTSSTCKEAAAKMGWAPTTASSMASRLRKAGVKLKQYKSGSRYDIDKLKALAEQYAGSEDAPTTDDPTE